MNIKIYTDDDIRENFLKHIDSQGVLPYKQTSFSNTLFLHPDISYQAWLNLAVSLSEEKQDE